MEKTAAISREMEVAPASPEHVESLAHQGAPTVGTVTLILEDGETVLLPTPSADPKGDVPESGLHASSLTPMIDPLNLPKWRKWTMTILISIYGCNAVVLASGLGPIFPLIQRDYPGQEARTNDLLTYPTLFMGIGNLLAMPLTDVIGRRPVFVVSNLVLALTSVWCAYSGSLGSHIAARNIMALAAGQSEALLPLMIQEIHFLHERARKLAWFIFIQNFTVGIFFFTSNYMVSAWGWRWWYGFFAIFNAVVFVIAVPLVSESRFLRPDSAATGRIHANDSSPEDGDSRSNSKGPIRITTKHGVVLDPERYGEASWTHSMKLYSKVGSWRQIPGFYLDFLRGFGHPILLWLLMLNGAYLGLYIFQASTFATILLQPPFSFQFNSLGYVQGAQVFVCMLFLPFLGYGGDRIIKVLSNRNGGIYRPEYRLPPLAVPCIATVICAIIYGQTAAFPTKWHWSGVAVSYNVIFFGFLGANIVGLTYAADSFPVKIAPSFVVICTGRGFISFGVSYGVLPAIKTMGYDGTMTMLGALCGGLALLAVPIYFVGPQLRKLGERYYGFGASKQSANDEHIY